MDIMCSFLPGDPRLVEQIVKELKSQGIFDQFRKECIADVDTKPAYQNLRQRVEGSVSTFLNDQTWSPDMNKNQVREMLRKHINDSDFLEKGVERIVDQVVNPKINTVFMPKVEDVLYSYLGYEKPKVKSSNSPKMNTVHDLLPKDLEAVSPEPPEVKVETDSKLEEISLNSDVIKDKIMQEENSVDSQSSVISGIVSHDSKDSLKQDSLMSLNSSESRMSLLENTSKIEEDACISQKSTDSNSKAELPTEEKINIEQSVENKDEIINSTETTSEKTTDESRSKSRDKDKKRDKHHSSSDRSKSRSDRDKDRSRSDKDKKEEKDGKTEEIKYKIPKISDKNKDKKSKDKDDKYKSDKGKSERDRSDKDKKYDKDRKSKHSSEKESSSSDRNKKDKNERRDKDDKRDKRESSKSDRSKDDKRSSSSSSSKKRDSSSSKDTHRDKDKERDSKSSKEDSSDKNKNGHSSSSSKRDSKSKKDEDKSKSSHKKDHKDDKEDRNRKRKSKDDHNSSKEKRNGGRSSDRDSDGPSSSKRPYVSPDNTNGEYSTQQTSQDSSGLNSEGSSGYSGNSDKAEDKNEVCNVLTELQKIKVPKFASNFNEAKKIMKIQKIVKVIKANPNNPEVPNLMIELEELTKDVKKEKKDEETKEVEEEENSVASKTETINIKECILSAMSTEKYKEMEAKLMQQVDYNSYESPYVDEEEVSFEKTEVVETQEFNESEVVLVLDEETEVPEEEAPSETEDKSLLDSSNKSLTEDANEEIDKTEEDFHDHHAEPNVSNHTEVAAVYDPTTLSKATEKSGIDVEEDVENFDPKKFKDFKQRAIVLLHKHALTEEMIIIKNKENMGASNTEYPTKKRDVPDVAKENIEANLRKEKNSTQQRNEENHPDKDKETILTKEHTENNLAMEEPISQDIDIYSLQNSCDLCSENKSDVCKGFEEPHNLKSLKFMQCIINILEKEIKKAKEGNLQYFGVKQEFQTRKRKVIEKKTDVSNNNLGNSASKRLEVEVKNQKNLSPMSKSTIGKLRTNLGSATETGNLDKVKAGSRTSEVKSRRQSGVSNKTADKAENQVHTKSNRSVDGSGEKRNKSNQRYSSDDLYKPRIQLRRSGRDSKNP